jgi:hypothetical protein
VIARKWGPGVGGLFLAFPAIFPASATLLEKHERQRKQQKACTEKSAAWTRPAVDALGAAMGSLGLVAFAAVCWWFIPRCAAAWVLAGAIFVWGLAAGCTWVFRKRRWRTF